MRLSREKIQRMIDAGGVNIGARRSSGGSGAGGGGGVSSQWVDDHYVSKEFFARLFTINGTDENDDDVVVEPNDLETTITNIQAMVGLWTEQYLSALGLSDGGSGGGEEVDEMLAAAVEVVLETGQASVSMLQRRLKLGYARAARIVDEMEEKGIVGPFQGSKPRAILVTKEQWEARKNGGQMDFDDLADYGVPEEI